MQHQCCLNLLFNGDIFTMNEQERASAMVFSSKTPYRAGPHFEGTICAVGDHATLLARFASEHLHCVNLQGATVVPAFTDSHLHLTDWARQRFEPDLDGLTSLEECLAHLRIAEGRLEANQWLCGGGWNWNNWREGRQPTRTDLDHLFPNRPVVLKSKDWHTLWCNTKALQMWNLLSTPPPIPGGLVELGSDGKANGLLRENAAFRFMGAIPGLTPAQKRESLLKAQGELLDLGIVAVHTMEPLENHLFLKALADEGLLRLRVASYILAHDMGRLEKEPELLSNRPTDQVRIVGVKMFADGSLGSRTAAMLNPYEGTTSHGMFTLSIEQLDTSVRHAEKLGLPCAIHAIGDAANRRVLDALTASRRRGFSHLRHRIEHCQLLAPGDIARFGEENIAASVQPTHLASDLAMVHEAWGARGRYAFPFGSLARSGAPLLFGSDAPVEPPNPRATISAATRRMREQESRALYPTEEGLTVEETLRAMTLAPAELLDEDSFRGSLSEGKEAHFTPFQDLK
jgi:predicted amidohydrolase YtcJ